MSLLLDITLACINSILLDLPSECRMSPLLAPAAIVSTVHMLTIRCMLQVRKWITGNVQPLSVCTDSLSVLGSFALLSDMACYHDQLQNAGRSWQIEQVHATHTIIFT